MLKFLIKRLKASMVGGPPPPPISKPSDVKAPEHIIKNMTSSAIIEQAIGKERLDFLGGYSSTNPFLMDPLKIRKYGPLDDPHLVPSYVGRRIIGCTGFPIDSHDILWMWVGPEDFMIEDGGDFSSYPPTRCPECGQAFKIKQL